MEAKNYH